MGHLRGDDFSLSRRESQLSRNLLLLIVKRERNPLCRLLI